MRSEKYKAVLLLPYLIGQLCLAQTGTGAANQNSPAPVPTICVPNNSTVTYSAIALNADDTLFVLNPRMKFEGKVRGFAASRDAVQFICRELGLAPAGLEAYPTSRSERWVSITNQVVSGHDARDERPRSILQSVVCGDGTLTSSPVSRNEQGVDCVKGATEIVGERKRSFDPENRLVKLQKPKVRYAGLMRQWGVEVPRYVKSNHGEGLRALPSTQMFPIVSTDFPEVARSLDVVCRLNLNDVNAKSVAANLELPERYREGLLDKFKDSTFDDRGRFDQVPTLVVRDGARISYFSRSRGEGEILEPRLWRQPTSVSSQGQEDTSESAASTLVKVMVIEEVVCELGT